MQRTGAGQAIVPGVRAADFLPWRRFDIHTTWSPEVAKIELAKRIGRAGFFGGGDSRFPFVGSAEGDRFEFRRRIGYRNSFLPAIVAEIRPDPRGARVAVRMEMYAFPKVFMMLWMAGATFGALAGLGAAAHGALQGLAILLLPISGGLLSGGSFGYEARYAEGLLRGIFPPAIDPEGPYR